MVRCAGCNASKPACMLAGVLTPLHVALVSGRFDATDKQHIEQSVTYELVKHGAVLEPWVGGLGLSCLSGLWMLCLLACILYLRNRLY